MLVNTNQALVQDLVLMIVGGGKEAKKLQKGIYQIPHFGGSHFMPDFDQFPDLSDIDAISTGVCDHPNQILEKFPKLESSDRKFTICVTPVIKDEQPPEGGWRWHKWGEYIGRHEPQHEYLYYEEGIEKIYTFHIYELK